MVSRRVTPNADQVPVNVVGSSTFGRYPTVSPELTLNMYVTVAGTPNTDDYQQWLVNFPGYRRVLNLIAFPNPLPTPPQYPDMLPDGEGRGIFVSTRGNIMVAVVNANVYVLTPTLGKTLIGTLNTAQGEVFMAENLNNQICIVDGTDMWIYNYTAPGSFTQQTGGPIGTALIPNYVEYHNTFFLIGNRSTASGSSAWYAYSFVSATTIGVTSTLALQTKADFPLAIKRVPGRGNNVLVLGKSVCEIHQQVGGLQNYLRNQTVNINYGCASVSTIADGGDIIAWLAVNQDEAPVIMAYDANGLKRISSDGIDYKLSRIKFPSQSTAILYRIDGHLFYQLTFFNEKDNVTLLYDFNTDMFFNLSNQDISFHPARQIVYFNLKNYFVSLRNAALYELNSDFTVIDENLPKTSALSTYDDNLVYDMQRQRVTASLRQANATRFRANSLVLTLEQGNDPGFSEIDLGAEDNLITEATFNPPLDDIITEFGSEIIDEDSVGAGGINGNQIIYRPRVDLAISKDSGITWSSYAKRDLNPIGFRQNMLHWENMGQANDICFKFRFFGTYRFVVNQAMVDLIS